MAISTRNVASKIRGKEKEILRVEIEVVIIREWKMEEIDEAMIAIDVLMTEIEGVKIEIGEAMIGIGEAKTTI